MVARAALDDRPRRCRGEDPGRDPRAAPAPRSAGRGRDHAPRAQASPTTSRTRTRARQFQAFTCRPSRAVGRPGALTTSRARRPSTRPAAWARWLTADWLMPSRTAASSYDSPWSTRSATSQPLVGAPAESRGPQPEHDSRSRAAASSPTTRRCQGLFLAVVTAVRAWRYAGPRPARALSGSGSSTVPIPMPMFQVAVPQQAFDGRGKRGGSSSTPWISSPAVRSKGRRERQVGQPGDGVGTRSGAVRLVRWSTVSTRTVIAPPPVTRPSIAAYIRK